MNHQEYMHYLRKGTLSHPAYDAVPRSYKNAQGIDTIIHLHRCYWDYVDWLEANTDIRFEDWVVHCDQNPTEGYTLSHQLMYWLWMDECARYEQGLATQYNFPPMGCQMSEQGGC